LREWPLSVQHGAFNTGGPSPPADRHRVLSIAPPTAVDDEPTVGRLPSRPLPPTSDACRPGEECGHKPAVRRPPSRPVPGLAPAGPLQQSPGMASAPDLLLPVPTSRARDVGGSYSVHVTREEGYPLHRSSSAVFGLIADSREPSDRQRVAASRGRQKAATRRNMRREERVTVQGPVKKQQPDGMAHGGSISNGGGGWGGGRVTDVPS